MTVKLSTFLRESGSRFQGPYVTTTQTENDAIVFAGGVAETKTVLKIERGRIIVFDFFFEVTVALVGVGITITPQINFAGPIPAAGVVALAAATAAGGSAVGQFFTLPDDPAAAMIKPPPGIARLILGGPSKILEPGTIQLASSGALTGTVRASLIWSPLDVPARVIAP